MSVLKVKKHSLQKGQQENFEYLIFIIYFTVLTVCGESLLAEEKPKVFGNPGT